MFMCVTAGRCAAWLQFFFFFLFCCWLLVVGCLYSVVCRLVFVVVLVLVLVLVDCGCGCGCAAGHGAEGGFDRSEEGVGGGKAETRRVRANARARQANEPHRESHPSREGPVSTIFGLFCLCWWWLRLPRPAAPQSNPQQAMRCACPVDGTLFESSSESPEHSHRVEQDRMWLRRPGVSGSLASHWQRGHFRITGGGEFEAELHGTAKPVSRMCSVENVFDVKPLDAAGFPERCGPPPIGKETDFGILKTLSAHHWVGRRGTYGNFRAPSGNCFRGNLEETALRRLF